MEHIKLSIWFIVHSWSYMQGSRKRMFLEFPRAYKKFMRLSLDDSGNEG